jgi:signal transduction histidine kinase
MLLIAAGAVMLFMLVVSSFKLSTETSARAEEISEQRLVRIAARKTKVGLLRAETGQRGFLLTGEDQYLEPYLSGIQDTKVYLAELRTNAKDPGDIERIEVIAPVIEKKLSELAQTVALVKSGKKNEALAIVAGDAGLKYMTVIRDNLEDITARADEFVGSGLQDLARSANRLSLTTTLGSLLLVSFAALAFYIIATNTGKLQAARQSLQDLTDELEDRVKDRTEALTEANEEIQRFAYIVSHDLRAPLVNIMGFTSELESASKQLAGYFATKALADPEQAAVVEIATVDIPESVNFIRKSSVRMDGLIGAILKLSREGRREFKRERVQLSEVVETTVASLQHQIDEGGVNVDVEPSLPSVVSDRLAIGQIVGNIIDNAVKYLAPGRPGEIKITSSESGGRVKLHIADNGRGIAEQDLKRIFDLFRRAGKPDRPGEGIGLAHVRSLVRALGGDVTVTSTLGEGTAFTIDLPKKMPGQTPASKEHAA